MFEQRPIRPARKVRSFCYTCLMNKNIEVELRGPLNEKEYHTTLLFLRGNGKLVKKQNRFLLAYSTSLEGIGERKLDVRVRVTNGKVEIVVKKGKFGGTSRIESSVFPEGSNLSDTLKFMSLLGYTKAVACDRGIERYEIDGIEFAIQDVRDFGNPGRVHSRFFEAEMMTDDSGKEVAVEKIRIFLIKQNLREFSENEWNEYVAVMNKEANGVFDYGEDDIGKVVNLGSV